MQLKWLWNWSCFNQSGQAITMTTHTRDPTIQKMPPTLHWLEPVRQWGTQFAERSQQADESNHVAYKNDADFDAHAFLSVSALPEQGSADPHPGISAKATMSHLASLVGSLNNEMAAVHLALKRLIGITTSSQLGFETTNQITDQDRSRLSSLCCLKCRGSGNERNGQQYLLTFSGTRISSRWPFL
jgi:hypothetical protein